jgi:hypothetical protein
MPVTAEHDHYWHQKEIFAFADAIVNKKLLMQIGTIELKNKIAIVTIKGRKAKSAKFCSTKDTGNFQDRKWNVTDAELHNGQARAIIPDGTTACYFNVTDHEDLTFSSGYSEIKIE